MDGKSAHGGSFGMLLLLRFLVSFCFIISCLCQPIKRENSRGHRSPPVHHPERECRRGAGPAARGGMRPARGAAGQQARPVQKTDGETGIFTRRAETSAPLTGQEVETTA